MAACLGSAGASIYDPSQEHWLPAIWFLMFAAICGKIAREVLDKTWKALETLAETFSKETRAAFGKRGTNVSATMEGELTVLVSDGCVVINGR